jgi:uncharacterized membrane protein YphA (DoxX/SURF4 family)
MENNNQTLIASPQYFAPGYLLAILRIYLGVILLNTVIGKLTADSLFSEEMLGFINTEVSRGRALPFYVHFLQSVVVPNAKLFSYLVMTGELTAGIGLLLGAFTRAAAFIALILFLNYMLAKGRMFWSPDSEDAAVFFIALAVMIGRAGRVFGLDRYLAKYPSLSFFC